MNDRTRHLLVSQFAPRFVLYYDVSGDVFTLNDATEGTLFKRRSMAAAVARLLGKGIDIVPCKVDRQGKLIKRSLGLARTIRLRRRPRNGGRRT